MVLRELYEVLGIKLWRASFKAHFTLVHFYFFKFITMNKLLFLKAIQFKKNAHDCFTGCQWSDSRLSSIDTKLLKISCTPVLWLQTLGLLRVGADSQPADPHSSRSPGSHTHIPIKSSFKLTAQLRILEFPEHAAAVHDLSKLSNTGISVGTHQIRWESNTEAN